MNDNGFAFFVAEPSIIDSKPALDFLNALNSNQFYLNLVLKIPPEIYKPHTSFQPILIGFSKEEYQKLFVADLDQDNISTTVQNFKMKKGTEWENGIWVNRESFKSFSNYSISDQISNLKTQYKEYEKYQLSDIASEINLTQESFEDKPNSIYIPKTSTSDVVSSLSNIKYKSATLSGIGAEKVGGRWNEVGTRAVYCSENISLALLEYYVHSESIANLPKDILVAKIEFPDEFIIEELAELPKEWK